MIDRDLTTTEALATVRARLDQAYAQKAEAEQTIKDLTLALIGIGKAHRTAAEPELTGDMYQE